MNIGSAVTYAKCKETQHIDAERRDAKGIVSEIAIIDGEECANVAWEWALGAAFWVRTGLLTEIDDM